jgi:putative permease
MEKTITRWIKFIFLLLALAGVIVFLFSIGDLVQILVISTLLTYILDPLVTSIEARGLNRTLSTLALFIVLAVLIGGMTLLALPFISAEIESLRAGVDADKALLFLEKAEKFFLETFGFLGMKNLNLPEKLGQAMVNFGNELIFNVLSLVSIVTNLVLTPIIVFFLLKDWRKIKKWLIGLVPNRYFEFTLTMIYKIDLQTGYYLRGQILDALIIGILSTFALWLLNVKYFIVIGIFAGLANLIPYIGPLSGAILAILVSLIETGDVMLAVYVAFAFAMVQIIDNAVVQPAVVARAVNLPPLLMLLAIIIGGKFFGILGMLLSVPVTGALKVTISEGYKIYRQYRFT